MDKDNTIDVEALLQSPGSQALENPITLDVLELIHNSSNTALSQRDRKRAQNSTGSSAEKPPRAKSRMQRAPKFHQLQIPSRTEFRRPYPSRAKYGGYDTKSIQNGLIWALKCLIYTLFELKSVNIRGVNLIMALYLPELT